MTLRSFVTKENKDSRPTFKRRLKTYLFCKFYDLAYPSDFMYAQLFYCISYCIAFYCWTGQLHCKSSLSDVIIIIIITAINLFQHLDFVHADIHACNCCRFFPLSRISIAVLYAGVCAFLATFTFYFYLVLFILKFSVLIHDFVCQYQ